ncbi:MAG: GDSL-type esterase/lipase family protein [Lentisphaeria bacterium]
MKILSSGTHTLVAFGDSTTAPRIVAGKPLAVYADLLRAELPARGIAGTVLNRGVPGNTTADARARFEADVLASRPDLTILQFGINDAAVDVWKNPPATVPRVAVEAYVANLTAMIRQLREAGSQVILMTPNPSRWRPELLALYGRPPYVPDDPMGLNVIIQEYVQAVRDLARAQQLPLVDVYARYLAYHQVAGQSMDGLLLDGEHPNARGHRLVADALVGCVTVLSDDVGATLLEKGAPQTPS